MIFCGNWSFREDIEQWTNEFSEQEGGELSNEYRQISNIVMDTLNSMVEVMGDERTSIDKFAKILAVGFEKE